jgi:hypothetical protein
MLAPDLENNKMNSLIFPEFANMTLEEAIKACVNAYDALPLPAQAQKRDVEMLIRWLDQLKKYRDASDIIRQAFAKMPT